MSILQLVANGLVLGAVYALVTLGFVLVVNATGAVNFAHGDLVMAGGYAAVLFGSLIKLPLLFLLPLVALAMFVLGVPPLLQGSNLPLGPIVLSPQAIATILVAALLIGGQYLIFFRTPIGRRLRAVAQDREMAQAIGIPAFRLIAITFGLGTALAGVAGAVLSNQFFVSPTGGVSLSIYGYIAVVVGGWGSIFGAVAGAIIIALFQVVASAFVPYTVATGGLYVALLVILFFRPQGLFGERIQRRV
jgi:branched-chain amino acid transport system permease protein